MITEISAGGVVVHKEKSGWLVLLMKDMKGSWTFPKGIINRGEKPREGAIREIDEEVGINGLTLVAPLKNISYMYRRGSLIQKSVYYFLFISPKKARPVVQLEEGIQEARWVTLIGAYSDIGYRRTNVGVLAEAEKLLERYER